MTDVIRQSKPGLIEQNLDWIRSQFPALNIQDNNQPVIFFDAASGTQVSQRVMDAIVNYYKDSNAGIHGAYATSKRTDSVIENARQSMADFLACDPDEIFFGQNMTTLTFQLSRSIARELKPGDEIVVTALDHEGNVSPWTSLEEQGIVIRMADICIDNCTLDLDNFSKLINARTKLVAVGLASNLVGTINDVAKITQLARAVGAMIFVDAVHYAPHGPISVHELDCDFLACSSYKFFGPHIGVMYGKREHLTRLRPYKVRPANDRCPSRWETGTQNHEGIAGVSAAIDYLAELGQRTNSQSKSRRSQLVSAMNAIQHYEAILSERLISGLLRIPEVTLYGLKDAIVGTRTPTVSIKIAGHSPKTIAGYLGERGIFTGAGNFYALYLTERLGVAASGGLLRIGLTHYNTTEEIERFLEILGSVV